MKKLLKNKFLICYFAIFFLLSCSTIVYLYQIRNMSGDPIRSDGMGYYIYLPAKFIYHDLAFSFEHPFFEGLNILENGAVVNKYPLGTAILETPFYFIADVIASLSSKYQADGFSLPYQYAIVIAALFYCFWGLIIVYDILRRYYSSYVVNWTMIFLCYGTSLFHYATFDASFSHVYSFFLISLFIWMVIKIEEENKTKVSYYFLLGVVAGLIFNVRNPNVIVVFFYIFYRVHTWTDLKKRFIDIFRLKKLIPPCLGGMMMISIQCIYWYMATGKPIIRSYGSEETFSWIFPHLYSVLASVSKGLIFYSPILGLALLGVFCIKRYFSSSISIMVVTILHLYITSAWDCWQYGGSFGQRPFVDVYCLYAILLACILQFFEDIQLKIINGNVVKMLNLLLPVFCLMLFWSLKMMLAYWHCILPIVDANMNDIWNVIQWNFDEMRNLIIK